MTPGADCSGKSGIIKDNGYLISAAQDPEAAQVLLKSPGATRQLQIRTSNSASQAVRWPSGDNSLDQRPGSGVQQPISRCGAHQVQNLAVAIAALEAFWEPATSRYSATSCKTACQWSPVRDAWNCCALTPHWSSMRHTTRRASKPPRQLCARPSILIAGFSGGHPG